MRVDPDIKIEQQKETNFLLFKKWLAILMCLVVVYFFLFKIVFF